MDTHQLMHKIRGWAIRHDGMFFRVVEINKQGDVFFVVIESHKDPKYIKELKECGKFLRRTKLMVPDLVEPWQTFESLPQYILGFCAHWAMKEFPKIVLEEEHKQKQTGDRMI